MEEKNMRDTMVEELSKNVCRVVFTKINGDLRDMECTLNTSLIPEDKRPKSQAKYTDAVIRAFDINKNEYRSFRVDNVQQFTVNS